MSAIRIGSGRSGDLRLRRARKEPDAAHRSAETPALNSGHSRNRARLLMCGSVRLTRLTLQIHDSVINARRARARQGREFQALLLYDLDYLDGGIDCMACCRVRRGLHVWLL
jgi:hypothetical protein